MKMYGFIGDDAPIPWLTTSEATTLLGIAFTVVEPRPYNPAIPWLVPVESWFVPGRIRPNRGPAAAEAA